MQIISAGEKSGHLSQSLKRVGEIYEEKTENTTKYLATILEPILLVVVWLGVVFIALAVILPIYSLVGGFNTDANNSSSATPPPVVETVISPESEEMPLTAPETDTSGDPDAKQDLVEIKVKIKKTETGFLNVRSDALKTSQLVGRVLPDEKYRFIEEKDGWYKIIIAWPR